MKNIYVTNLNGKKSKVSNETIMFAGGIVWDSFCKATNPKTAKIWKELHNIVCALNYGKIETIME